MSLLTFEDFQPGETRTYGNYRLDEAELLQFSAAYDPQPFHLDAGAAKDTILGGLAASGWQVCSLADAYDDRFVARRKFGYRRNRDRG